MAITPRSKGLGNIGAIVNREGRASVAAPVRPTSVSKPKIAAPVKPAPRPVVRKPATAPAPKPVAKVAPKPAPKMAPSPFNKKPDTRAPGGGGMDINGNPIGGGMGGQFNIAAPGQGNLARNTGPGNGAPRGSEFYRQNPVIAPPPGYDFDGNRMMPNPGDYGGEPTRGVGGPQLIGGAFGRPIFGGPPTGGMDPNNPFGNPIFASPQYNPSMGGTKELYDQYNNMRNRMTADVRPEDKMNFQQFVGYRNGTYTPPPDDYGMPGEPNSFNPSFPPNDMLPPGYQDPYMPPEPPPGYDFGNPGYGGPYTPRPDMGPGVGFGVGLPQPGQGGGFNGYPSTMEYMGPDVAYGEPAPYNAGMQSPSRVINQVGKPGFQPRTNMSNAFNPTAVSDYDQLEGPGYNTGGFMGGGTGSMFGGGGFAGK